MEKGVGSKRASISRTSYHAHWVYNFITTLPLDPSFACYMVLDSAVLTRKFKGFEKMELTQGTGIPDHTFEYLQCVVDNVDHSNLI